MTLDKSLHFLKGFTLSCATPLGSEGAVKENERCPLSLTQTSAHDGGGIKVEWSTPLQPRQMIPTANLYPITPR